jgi:hypothetical protein
MSEAMRVLALGNDVVRNAFMGTGEGGEHLESGLAAALAAAHSDYELNVTYSDYDGLSELRTRLQHDTLQALYGVTPRIVILGMSREVERLAQRSTDPHEAIARLREDLVGVFDAIKADCDAHVVAIGVSTFDPGDPVSNLHGFAEEPVMLRCHRINLALFQTSHEVGLSVIDVDRLVAEAGGGRVVPAPLALSPDGSALVRDETLRVLFDYGFFDERSLIAQVGNRGATR